MTSKSDGSSDILTCGDVKDGKWISLLWDGEEWLVSSQVTLPRYVRNALNDMLVSKLNLPDDDEIEDKSDETPILQADVELIDLDEWRRNPETGANGRVSIDKVAFIDEIDGEWIVDPTPQDELQVTV